MPPAPLPIAWTYSHSMIGRPGRVFVRWTSSSTVAYMRDTTSTYRSVVVVLVVHRTPRVAPVDPRGHGGEVAARPRLVAERPGDDAGVVLVALDHAARPVEVHLAPVGVVGRVAHPAVRLEAVGLEVALVDDPEAELVGEVEQRRVRRVVARADRVEVVPLHEQHRLAHPVGVEHPTVDRVEVVPVDAAEPHAASVHQPGIPVDLDAAEPRAHRDGLGRVGDLDLVEARRVRAPGVDRADVEGVGRGGVRRSRRPARARGT